jgi:hypothetical protein
MGDNFLTSIFRPRKRAIGGRFFAFGVRKTANHRHVEALSGNSMMFARIAWHGKVTGVRNS